MDESIVINSKSPMMLQYFVPFNFSNNRFSEICRTVTDGKQDGSGCWEETTFPLEDNTIIYAHVLAMMNVRKNESSVCRSWKYQPEENDRYLFVDHRSREEQVGVVFSLSDIHIHLCKTGVGFVSYQAVFENCKRLDSAILVRFQNRIKKLNFTNKQLWILRSRSNAGSEEWNNEPESRKQVMLGKKILELIPAGLRPEIQFIGTGKDDPVPPASLLFSYVCYNCEDRDRLKETTVHMAMGFDLRNRQSKETNQSCHELANDVFYYVAQGGCAISVISNAENEYFFVKNSPAAKYSFVLFLLLYQHCSLLNFTMRLYTDFPSDSQSYLGSSAYAEKMQDFLTDVDTFLMKSDLSTVSHIQSYNLFYTACRKALNIEEDKQSLRSGFESLSSIQRSKLALDREAQVQAEQENQEKFNHMVEYLAIILGLIECLSEGTNFIHRVHLLIRHPSELGATDYIGMALFLAVLVVVVILFIRIRMIRRAIRRRKR